MFSHLFESAPRRRGMRNVSGTSLSFAIHALLVFGAVWATQKSIYTVVDTHAVIDNTPYVSQPDRPDAPPAPPIDPLTSVSFPDAPIVIPVGIPPVDPGFVIDTLTILRSRIGAESATSIGGVTPQDGNAVIDEHAVDDRPEVVSGFVPEYPDLLRQAGIEGTVIVELVVDTAGRAEAGSVRVIQSSNHAFDISAREAVLRTVYRPGRVKGHAVRVLVQVPIAFSIQK
jgi:protein TonB